MFVEQAMIDQIRGKMRRRVLELPVRYGSRRRNGRWDPEVRKCPMREGGVYTLTPGVTHAQYRTEALTQPTRARAVLWLIDHCEPLRTVTITVTRPPERHGDIWLIHFAKGDRASDLDRPIFLSKDGGYTMSASKQAVPGDPEVLMPLAEDLMKARAKARERRISPERQGLRQRAIDAETFQQSMAHMKARLLVKRAQRNYEAAERLLSAEVVDCFVSTAADGSQGEEGRPPNASAAEASLGAEAAA